ncbi:MAG: hypothetical protein JRH20_02760 [Deltaproteobacteria bacterium]|nr:hypothetical protein [Deltaproteobacteria bacterium]
MSQKQMVLTAVGPDAPGRVKQISSFILDSGCNLEDSRMAMLAGEFALIVLFTGSQDGVAQVERGREALEKQLDFSITLRSTQRPEARDDCLAYELRVGGVDQPGIVYGVSQALAALEINVASFDSRLEPAAFSGTPVFTLHAELQVPGRPALAQLQEALEALCDDKNLSYSLDAMHLRTS